MKEVQVMEWKHIPVSALITKYESTDGTQYGTKEEAEKHDMYLTELGKVSNFEKIDFDLFPFGEENSFYHCKTKEDLDTFINLHGGIKQNYVSVYVYGDLTPGAWVATHFDDGGDYGRDSRTFVTLDYFCEKLGNIIPQDVTSVILGSRLFEVESTIELILDGDKTLSPATKERLEYLLKEIKE
jgi:hypothetical protein